LLTLSRALPQKQNDFWNGGSLFVAFVEIKVGREFSRENEVELFRCGICVQ
jgi:hypothetical protein